MKLIITRHGETEENKAGIVQGHLPGKLSQDGIIQAKKVADRLKDEKFDFIYSSDLARTSDTAKIIIKYHPDVPVEFVKELRERYLGEFQGKKRSDIIQDLKNNKATSFEPKEGETKEQLHERANKFLDQIIRKHKNDTVLFVGHNGINKALISVIMGKSFDDIENQHNTSINIFEINEDKNHKIHALNCTKHLNGTNSSASFY